MRVSYLEMEQADARSYILLLMSFHSRVELPLPRLVAAQVRIIARCARAFRIAVSRVNVLNSEQKHCGVALDRHNRIYTYINKTHIALLINKVSYILI